MQRQDTSERRRDYVALARIPMHERVLDRLADLMLDADELLAMFDGEDAAWVRWIEPHVRRAFDEVDAAMRRMTD
jgi:hypothetical protein